MLRNSGFARFRPLATLSAAFLGVILSASALASTAVPDEVIYRVKWKDREFHLIGSSPFRPPGADPSQTMLTLVANSGAVAFETDLIVVSKAGENFKIAQRATSLMPAKKMPAALKEKFAKAFTKAYPKAGQQIFDADSFFNYHLFDTAMAIRSAAAPFPGLGMTLPTDNMIFIRASYAKRPILPIISVTQYYESLSTIPRADMEAFISLAADSVIDEDKGAAWKAAHARCYTALINELPTRAHEACIRDLNRELKIPPTVLQGMYDRRNPLLLDSLLAIVEKEEKLVASLHVLHLGGPSGILRMLNDRGATFERIHGGPPRK